MMEEMTISVRADFTQYPGPRYRKDDPFSGEEFRDTILAEKLREAMAASKRLRVIIDDVAGYGNSFLEEAFGGLVRVGFTREELDGHLQIVANTPRFQHHKKRAEEYVQEALARVAAA